MSSFVCDKCGAECVDTPIGYVTGCEHYPADVKPLPTDMATILHDNLWDLYERDDKTANVEVSGLRGFSRRSARLPGWVPAYLNSNRTSLTT